MATARPSRVARGVFALGSFALASLAAAEEAAPFKLVRSDEDYGRLADPVLRAAAPEAYKYLPVGSDAYVSLGGEIRERYDVFDAPRFGIGQRSDAYDLQRILVHADVHVDEALRVYVEAGNHDVFGKRTAVLPVDRDPTNLENAFIDYHPRGDARWRIRLGRQELVLDTTQRFIAAREGPNLRLSYDGERVTWRDGGWQVDAFSLRPRLVKDEAFGDRGDPATLFSGLYVARALATVHGTVDAYWIALDHFGARYGATVAAERRRGLGARVAMAPLPWDFEAEVLWQYGTYGSADIRAAGGGLEGGYTFTARGHPRASLRLDGATGGAPNRADRLGTFNPLFPKGLYFDESTLTTYANLVSVRPSVTLTPARALSVQLSAAWRYRQNVHDALYLIPFVSLPQTFGNTIRHVGQWSILDVLWRANRYLTLQGEYVHIVAGGAIRAAGGHDVDFEMLIAQLRF